MIFRIEGELVGRGGCSGSRKRWFGMRGGRRVEGFILGFFVEVGGDKVVGCELFSVMVVYGFRLGFIVLLY